MRIGWGANLTEKKIYKYINLHLFYAQHVSLDFGVKYDQDVFLAEFCVAIYQINTL